MQFFLSKCHQTKYRLFWLVLALLTQSCAQLTPQPVPQAHTANVRHFEGLKEIKLFQLQGRIGIQNAGQGFSGKIYWLHKPTQDTIDLFSPFGSQIARIEKTDEQITFSTDQGDHTVAQDEKSLMQKQLGWSIPIQALVDWSLGRTHQVSEKAETINLISASETQIDEQGRFKSFLQDGWKIEYQDYQHTQGYDLPSKLTLRKDDLYLKLIIESWEIHSSSSNPL
jgi:outer membrane lipoprotein LolB